MFNVEDIASESWPQASVKDVLGNVSWVKAEPVRDPLSIRIKNAWKVLTGEYRAVSFYKIKSP